MNWSNLPAPSVAGWMTPMPVMTGRGLRATGGAGAMVLRLAQEVPVYGKLPMVQKAAAVTHPFKCPGTTNGTTPSVIVGGTVRNTVVTNGAGAALPGGTVVISNSGTQYVYLEVTITKNVQASGYVVGIATIVSAKMKTGGSVPADTATVLYKQVARYVDGVKVTQDRISSLEVEIRGYNAAGNFNAYWGAS